MKRIAIYNPSSHSKSVHRGGGRVLQILHETIPSYADFLDSPPKKGTYETLLVPYWSLYDSPLMLKRLAKRQILMMFDVMPLKYPTHFPAGLRGQINLLLNRYAFTYYDDIITISRHARKDIIDYLGISRTPIHVLYPTLSHTHLMDKNPTRNIIPRSVPETYFLYAADVNWNKNLVNMARAVKKLNTPCVCVGKPFSRSQASKQDLYHPWLEEYRIFLKETEGDKRFIFLGYVPDSVLISLYAHALCTILVSRDEGFGLSYLEASAQCTPSVLSDTPIFHEIAGSTACYADPENTKDISANLESLLENESKRQILGERAHKHCQKYYPSHFKNNLLKILL